MNRRSYFFLYAMALAILAVVASFQHSPGYMDADYYQLTGQQISASQGFSEPVLWNYLDDPQGLPHPSHSYWMPLPSLLVAAGTRLVGDQSFFAGRILFIALAAAIAPLTSLLAFQLTQKKQTALLAGGFALFPAFYLPYLPTTDTFGISMLLGGLLFLILIASDKKGLSSLQAASLGLLAGLLHLNRAEGPLWIIAAFIVTLVLSKRRTQALWTMAGYLLIMGPWVLRNWLAFGTLLSPGAGQTLWLTSYNELFAYPASQLTMTHWLSSGWAAILGQRLAALGQNLLSALVVQGLIFLAPLAIWGGWLLRKKFALKLATGLWLALLFAMSLVFPFSGSRGGFFHAAAALQPMIWVSAAIGLQAFIEWGASQRGWSKAEAGHILAAGGLIIALGLSAYVVNLRVIGANLSQPTWDASDRVYKRLGEELLQLNILRRAIVMVNNPPGFALATGRDAIAIPDGDLETTLAVAQRYGADVLLLEVNHPAGLNELYEAPTQTSDLEYVKTIEGTHVFFIP